ncbi:related to HOL1 protein (member of major facilitator superfamily) [Phialocephala subalpina]|uniref:Related to HOL1 protein (Member of major facilitator superfamily) n=1 Tax=Phialocephala subalpina TaxID=576137 RepID=A0A1L7XY28_9HELO|nr:related to HOL1 protein (member of major facilitator superfamily) [Phialocephala subalpina]
MPYHHEDEFNSSDITAPHRYPIKTLGHVRLQDETGATLLVPQPSSDPNDPLNWSKAFKVYIAVLTCAALTWVNFFAAGPSTVLVEIVIDIFGAYPPDPRNPASLSLASIAAFTSGVSKAALLFSTTSVAAGMSNILWVPLAVKYGRRVVYTFSFLAFGLCCIWSARATSYGSLLASRIIASWFSGSAECIAPMTIADIFFLHERGRMTAMYSAALSTGAALGSLISGAMSVSQSWRSFHYLCAALVLATTVLIFFTMPETAYQRDISGTEERTTADTKEAANVSQVEHVEESNTPPKKSFTQRMAFTHSPLTNESIWKIASRPVPVLLLPPVLWSTVSFGIGIGIFVILGTTAATAFSQVYNFTVWQVGLVWIASIVGNLLGIPFGGYFSDWVANRATSKNGGVREPEMRLPAVSIAMFAYPGSLLLYGLGINYKTHWIVPTLVSFGSSAAIGISVVYTIDCYRPIAGEVVVSQVVFKSVITFLMSFYANPWVDRDGYAGAFAAMASFSFVILALWIPIYIWGKQIRRATFKWRVVQLAHWDADRETGE